MPTVGWIYEDSVERFLAGTTLVPDPTGPLPERFNCPFCAASFESAKLRSNHLQATHVGQRPIILLHGREPTSHDTIRKMLPAGQIEFLNCTSIRRLRSGDRGELLTPREATYLLSQSPRRIRLELLNNFEPSASPITQRYDLQFQVATTDQLDAVDRAFIQTLGRPDPKVSDVDNFLRRPESLDASEYAQALAEYVIAVLVKDGDAKSGVRPQTRDYRPKLNSALRVLQWFDRPLSNLICGFIRLSSNDVGRSINVTGHVTLDAALCVLNDLSAGRSPHLTVNVQLELDRGVPVCPIDNGTDRVIRRTRWLWNLHRLSSDVLAQLASELDLEAIDPFDKIKLAALWAGRAVQLDHPKSAIKPLRELVGDPIFGQWARVKLEKIDD